MEIPCFYLPIKSLLKCGNKNKWNWCFHYTSFKKEKERLKNDVKKIWFSSIYFSAKHLQKRKSWRSKAETVLMWMYSVHTAYFITLSFSGVLDFSKFGKRVILSKSQLNRNITFSYRIFVLENDHWEQCQSLYNPVWFKKILETATVLCCDLDNKYMIWLHK